MFIFASQNHRIERLIGKVDLIITDSPLLLSLIYNPYKDNYRKIFLDLVIETYNKNDNLNMFLIRNTDFIFNCNGRIQTLNESKNIDKKIESLKSYINGITVYHEVGKNIENLIRIINEQKAKND